MTPRDWLAGGWKQGPYAKTINGQVGIDTDGLYGFQCKDFVNAYAFLLGHPFTAGNASALWDRQQDTFWQRIDSSQRPEPGDVFVRKFFADGTEYGHTGVIESVDAAGFWSWDQNWFNSSLKVGSPPARVRHGFDNIRGYLRPEGDDMSRLGLTKEEATVLYALAVPGQGVNADWVTVFTGKSLEDALHDLQNDPSVQKYITSLLTPKPMPGATVLAPGLYQVPKQG